MTGGRIKRIKQFVENETFICTYGDGIADIDINALLEFHKSHGKIATMTAAQPSSRFGVLELGPDGSVTNFKEKPKTDGWVNIGYFVFEPAIFEFLEDDSTVLEQEPLKKLAQLNQIAAFKHGGFWEPMDTYREAVMLNQLWDSGKAPWRSW